MSFQDDEQSIQDSKPVELFEFTNANGQVTRYTGWAHDIIVGGLTYTAVVGGIRRGPIQVVSGIDQIPTFTVELPATDPVVQAYAGFGVPPQTYTVKCIRFQQRSALTQQVWFGFVDTCSFRSTSNKRTAVFSVPSVVDRPLGVQIPKVVVARLCNHVLYDSMCQAIRNQISPTIAGLTGNVMTVSSIGGFAVDDFPFGEVQHINTKERRTIVSQDAATGLVLTLDVAWPTSVHVGDVVTLFPGCDHTVITCRDKFANVVNFGGHPHIQSANFFWFDLRQAQGK